MSERAMQEATFLILTALAAGCRHGYGIMTDVAQTSDGRVRLRAGTLYAALDRLRSGQLIEVDREEIVDTRLRRYYRLTPEGGQRLAAEAAQQRQYRTDPAEPGWRNGMTDRTGLERGYRRLLACYPQEYWREHEEEMLAVLLANARDGQRRPGLAESADLIGGRAADQAPSVRGRDL